MQRVSHSFQRLMSILPQQYITFAVGYGSGVYQQQQHSVQGINTIDIILTVNNSNQFHKKNYELNSSHYSGLCYYLGSNYINWLNKKVFPIHYNHIRLQNSLIKIKYSVIQENHFQQDLVQWNMLSVAGRLHKPVLKLMPLPKHLSSAFKTNQDYAFSLGLLMITCSKKEFSMDELYMEISRLSYIGDIRFLFKFQNPNKVKNIVVHNLSHFINLYQNKISQIQHLFPQNLKTNGSKFIPSLTPKFISYLCDQASLPPNIYNRAYKKLSIHYKGPLARQLLVLGTKNIPAVFEEELKAVNRKSSFLMATHNLLSGSPLQNAAYLLAKWKKKFL